MTCENLRLHPINGSDPFRLSGVKAKLFDPRMIFSPATLWTYWSDVVIISERSWPGWVNLSLWLLRISSAIHTLLWAFTPEKNIHFISPDLDSEISRHIKPGSFYKDLTNHYFNCPYLPVMWLGIAISHRIFAPRGLLQDTLYKVCPLEGFISTSLQAHAWVCR